LLEFYVVIHREVGFLGKGYGENLLFPRKEGFPHKKIKKPNSSTRSRI